MPRHFEGTCRTALFLCLLAVGLSFAPAAKAENDALSVMRGYGYFNIFCDLIERADLVATFQAAGPITVFAPEDAAFERMSPDARRRLETPEHVSELRALILYHVVDGRLSAFELKREKPYGTVAGKRVQFLDMGGSLMINDAFIDTADIRASNGLIHEIDKVLTPP
jgi:uncharacterized surface protein with fasciclin (FAS1) repeats